jgi:hypothetical protein
MGTTWRDRVFTSGKMPPTLATAAVSCASEGLCLATATTGNVSVSTDPASGTAGWIEQSIDPGD